MNRSESFPQSPASMLGAVDGVDASIKEKSIVETSRRNTSGHNILFFNNKTNNI